MFTIPIIIWLVIGLICFGVWFGYNENSLSDIDFKTLMQFIIFTVLGPINVLFAFARVLGVIGRAIADG